MCRAQWLLELWELFSHEEALPYIRLPEGIMDSLGNFCRNQGLIQPCFSGNLATPNPCCFSVPPRSLHCTHRSCSTSLSAPQDSALGVAKFFKEVKLNLIQISWSDISSTASITMVNPKPGVPEVMLLRQEWCWWIPYSEPRAVSSPTVSIPSLVFEMQVSLSWNYLSVAWEVVCRVYIRIWLMYLQGQFQFLNEYFCFKF